MRNANEENSIQESTDHCVPYFRTDHDQIKFEFTYLSCFLILLFAAAIFTNQAGEVIFSTPTKTAVFALIGGLSGGWAYDAKWFYRVTARGRNNQYNFRWEKHKFYWRILIPFVAGSVAFAVYLLAVTKVFPLAITDNSSSRAAFAICFFLAFFSDLALSRLAAWAEGVLPSGSKAN